MFARQFEFDGHGFQPGILQVQAIVHEYGKDAQTGLEFNLCSVELICQTFGDGASSREFGIQ